MDERKIERLVVLVSKEEKENVIKFCESRDLNQSEFIRRSIFAQIENAKKKR